MLQGDLDLETTPVLRAVLQDHVGRDVVIDMAGVSFLDATAIGVLVASCSRARATQNTLQVRNLQTRPRHTLDLVGVLDPLAPG